MSLVGKSGLRRGMTDRSLYEITLLTSLYDFHSQGHTAVYLPTVFRQDWCFTQATTLHFCPLPALFGNRRPLLWLFLPYIRRVYTDGQQSLYKRVHLFLEDRQRTLWSANEILFRRILQQGQDKVKAVYSC